MTYRRPHRALAAALIASTSLTPAWAEGVGDRSIQDLTLEEAVVLEEQGALSAPQTIGGVGFERVLLGLGLAAAVGFLGASGGDDVAPTPVPTPDPTPQPDLPPVTPDAPNPDFTPNTTDYWMSAGEFTNQWGLVAINAQHRLADGARGAGTLGAFVDSGADVNNPEFAGRIDTANSYSYYTQSNDVTDYNGHGTHTLGTAGAAFDGSGIMGVAPEANFVIYQLIGAEVPDIPAPALGLDEAFADIQDRAVSLGVDAINNSWGVGNPFLGGETTIIDVGNRDDYITKTSA